MSKIKSEEDTHSYKGWLNSDSFLKRAFAIVGYSWIPGLFIFGIIYGIGLIFAILETIFGA